MNVDSLRRLAEARLPPGPSRPVAPPSPPPPPAAVDGLALTTPRGPLPGRMLAPGVWLTKQTLPSGLPVRQLTVDPRQARLAVVFADGQKPLDPPADAVASINGTFFGAATYGDLVGGGRRYRDEGQKDPNYDRISDKRFFLALDGQGRLMAGQGGLEAVGGSPPFFLGGLGRLFDPQTPFTGEAALLSRLEQEGRNGVFPRIDLRAKRPRSVAGIDPQGRLIVLALGEGRRGGGVSVAEACRRLREAGALSGYLLDGGSSTHLNAVGEPPARPARGRKVTSYLAVYPLRR